MLWLAVVCAVIGALLFVAGLAFYTNGAGLAPAQRTGDDPTGFKRATSRVEWGDLFRRMPRAAGFLINKQAERSDKMMALGSLCVLVSMLAGLVALLAFIAALA
jgi:hypothetical protein